MALRLDAGRGLLVHRVGGERAIVACFGRLGFVSVLSGRPCAQQVEVSWVDEPDAFDKVKCFCGFPAPRWWAMSPR